MSQLPKTPVAIAMVIGLAALPSLGAAQTDPGAQLLQMWDSNSDGNVTLAEVQTRRADIFTAFDSNGDDVLTPDEMALIDEMRSLQQEEMGSDGGGGKGHGQGQGQGKGQGQGQGKGHGNDGGQAAAPVSRADFVAKAADWLARKDRNGDGVLTAADFGQ